MTEFSTPNTPPTAQTPNAPPTTRTDPFAIDAAQRQTDLEHLRILAVMHYVFAGLTALAGCAAIVYLALGVMFVINPELLDEPGSPPPPRGLGFLFIGIGGCGMILAWAMAILIIYAGRCLARQRHRIFCMVIAALMCLSVPLGTILGVFTLVVLARPSVAALLAQTQWSRMSA